MKKNLLVFLLIAFCVLLITLLEFFLIKFFFCDYQFDSKQTDNVLVKEQPKAMMLLIEFKNTDGLVNMVNDMHERNIKGLLMVNADFVEKNAVAIKKALETGNIEIAASYDPEAYWGMSYERQYQIISDMVTRINKALGVRVRIISSRYMASDENTVKVAQELGIEYITARGTTDLETIVYKPLEYNVKIISVSNIDTVEFKYGSFCDYSYYERSGSPEDMTKDYERAITNEKFIGVSHTYIGGIKSRWNDMWHKHWDNYDVNWVNLDELGEVDKYMPMWQIPINKNAPYTPEKIRPVIPYDEEENVANPCLVDELPTANKSSNSEEADLKEEVVVFHNNTGPMCIEALNFFSENNIKIKQYINTENDYYKMLGVYQKKVPISQGFSNDFQYFPFIFVGDKAYSGFSQQIGDEILDLLN